jgi:hypothetical protein
VDRINLAKDRVQWQTSVNSNKPTGSINALNLLVAWATISCLRGTSFRVVRPRNIFWIEIFLEIQVCTGT